MKRTALSLLVLCAASAHAANVVIPGSKPAAPAPAIPANEVTEAEPHRAGRILKQLLVGRSTDRCVFWSDARSLLRTLPGQAEALDQDQADPCAISPELQKAIADSREAVRKERSVVADLNYDRAKLPAKVGELADVYRAMDQTRMLLLDLRESFMECDSIEKNLTADSTTLKDS